MKVLWESPCKRCHLPLADHTEIEDPDPTSEFVEPLWRCPDGGVPQ